MGSQRRKWCCRAMAVAGCLILLGAGPAYTIRLERADTAGETYDTHKELEQSQTMDITIQGVSQPGNSQVVKGDLKGRVSVGKVDAKGTAIELSVTIKTLTDGSGKVLIDGNKVIDIKRGEKQVDITMRGGGEISDDAKKVLTGMYPPHTTKNSSDDDVFGTDKPQSVGDSWPVHGEAMVGDLSREGIEIEAKNVSGQTTLKGVEKSDGKEALRINAGFNVKDVKVPSPDPSMTVDASALEAHFDGLFPVDTAMPAMESSEVMDMRISVSSKSSPVRMDIKTHQMMKETITQVKK